MTYNKFKQIDDLIAEAHDINTNRKDCPRNSKKRIIGNIRVDLLHIRKHIGLINNYLEKLEKYESEK